MKTAVWLSVASVLGVLAMSNSAAWGQEAAAESPDAQQQNVPFEFQNPPADKWEVSVFQNQAAANWPVLTNAGTVNLTLATFGNPLGVEVAAVEAALRAQINIEEGKGVVITNVREDSEAAKAGLKQYDIVLAIDHQPIDSPEKLDELVGGRQGKEVQFHVLRQGKPQTLSMKLPDTPVYQFANVYAGELLANIGGTTNQYRLGVTLAEADDALRSQLRLATGEGLVVTEVLPDSPAAKAGMRQHDVLIKLEGKRLSTVENINALIQEIKDRQVTLAFVRGGEEMSCEVTPQLGIEPAANLFLGDAVSNYNVLQPLVVRKQLRLLYQPLEVKLAPPAATAADQVAALKKQLADVQRSLEALEASLNKQPAAQPPPAAEPPQEQAPSQSNGEN